MADRIAAIDRAIVENAESLFLGTGYANTSMQAVLTAAGVSKSALYSRYGSKGALFNAVVSYRLQAWFHTDAMREPLRTELGMGLIAGAVDELASMSSFDIRAFERLLTTESGRFSEIAQAFCDGDLVSALSSCGDELSARRIKSQSATQFEPPTLVFLYAVVGWFITGSAARSQRDQDCDALLLKLAELFGCTPGVRPEIAQVASAAASI
jgi:AcrR family transcriptional regulator